MPESTIFPDGHELNALHEALHGQYEIQRELGRGGMGIVVLARDERLDRQVALKVLPPSLARQSETRERFLREARMSAQLSHPNIVPVYRADEIGGFAFFAMGFVDGETLAERMHDRGILAPDVVIRMLREVAWALAYAHARGIVHRDVKPENILIERATGRAVVTDFGIARADFHPSLTQEGLVLGTVHYMSPEQVNGSPLDGRSDLYALGCVGYLGLSGRMPFEDESPHAVLVAHATRQPPSLRESAPDLPIALTSAIDRCLLKRPEDRFSTGEELADALGKAMDAIEARKRDDGSSEVLSNGQALEVWKRAAELQAEAAARLEARMRDETQTRTMIRYGGDGNNSPVVPHQSSRQGSALDGADNGASTADAAHLRSPKPTDSYRVRDVEAAALEVGISQRYVALAMAELQSSPLAVKSTQPVSAWKNNLATTMLGSEQRTLSVSRVFRFPPRETLKAIGRAFQSAPYSLSLRDTVGGHPLDGGVLVFDVPSLTEANYKWTWTRYGVYVPELRVTLAQVPGDSQACEVSIHLDLRRGLNACIAGHGFFAGLGSGVGAVAGGVVGAKALAIAGAALLGPIAGGGLALRWLAVTGLRPIYRWEIRKSTAELESLLAAVETSIMARDIFGDEQPRTKTTPWSAGAARG